MGRLTDSYLEEDVTLKGDPHRDNLKVVVQVDVGRVVVTYPYNVSRPERLDLQQEAANERTYR